MAIEILFSVAVLLIFAKIFGEIAERLKMPSLVGEIIGGAAAGAMNFVSPSPLLAELAGLGMLFVVFLIGLGTNMEELKGRIRQGGSLAAMGAVLSFIAGFFVGYYAYGLATGIVLGIVLAATSSQIALRAVSSVGELHSKAGKMITSAAAANDIISMVAIATAAAYFSFPGEIWKVATIFLGLSLLIAVILALAKSAGKLLRLVEEIHDDQFVVAGALVALFLLSYATQSAGIAAVGGAFAAGLLLSRTPLTEGVIQPKIKTVANGFFIPLFFAYLALQLDFGVQLQLVALMLLLGVAAKFAGSWLLGAYYGLRGRERITAGAASLPRGEISIITAYIAAAAGAISAQAFTAVVMFSLLSIVLTSVIFHFWLKQW